MLLAKTAKLNTAKKVTLRYTPFAHAFYVLMFDSRKVVYCLYTFIIWHQHSCHRNFVGLTKHEMTMYILNIYANALHSFGSLLSTWSSSQLEHGNQQTRSILDEGQPHSYYTSVSGVSSTDQKWISLQMKPHCAKPLARWSSYIHEMTKIIFVDNCSQKNFYCRRFN